METEHLTEIIEALPKLINSLSWGRNIKNPEPIESAETIMNR